jgi:hypothetical protein
MQLIDTPEQMDALPDYSVVVSAVTICEELGGNVAVAMQKIAGEWYPPGMGSIPTDTRQLRNFFPATLVFQIDHGVTE